MKVGDELLVLGDFTKLQEAWGFKYPKVNEIVTISKIGDYTGKSGIATLMLNFVEYPDLPPMCEDQYDGKLNFKQI